MAAPPEGWRNKFLLHKPEILVSLIPISDQTVDSHFCGDFPTCFSSSGAGWARLWLSRYQSRWVSSPRSESRRKRFWLRQRWPPSRGEAPTVPLSHQRSHFALDAHLNICVCSLGRTLWQWLHRTEQLRRVKPSSCQRRTPSLVNSPLPSAFLVLFKSFSSRATAFTAWAAVRTPDWLSGSMWHQGKGWLSVSFSFS